MKVPTMSGPVLPVLPATMLFLIEALPELLIPPAVDAELLVTVQLSKSTVPPELFCMPPAELPAAVLPLIVLLLILIKPALLTTPPAVVPKNVTEFPLTVLSKISRVPELLLLTPPAKGALFPVTLQRVRVILPVLAF